MCALQPLHLRGTVPARCPHTCRVCCCSAERRRQRVRRPAGPSDVTFGSSISGAAFGQGATPDYVARARLLEHAARRRACRRACPQDTPGRPPVPAAGRSGPMGRPHTGRRTCPRTSQCERFQLLRLDVRGLSDLTSRLLEVVSIGRDEGSRLREDVWDVSRPSRPALPGLTCSRRRRTSPQTRRWSSGRSATPPASEAGRAAASGPGRDPGPA